jgi:hypothetical protein
MLNTDEYPECVETTPRVFGPVTHQAEIFGKLQSQKSMNLFVRLEYEKLLKHPGELKYFHPSSSLKSNETQMENFNAAKQDLSY